MNCSDLYAQAWVPRPSSLLVHVRTAAVALIRNHTVSRADSFSYKDGSYTGTKSCFLYIFIYVLLIVGKPSNVYCTASLHFNAYICLLSFHQYKNGISGQILHTGTLSYFSDGWLLLFISSRVWSVSAYRSRGPCELDTPWRPIAAPLDPRVPGACRSWLAADGASPWKAELFQGGGKETGLVLFIAWLCYKCVAACF